MMGVFRGTFSRWRANEDTTFPGKVQTLDPFP